MKHRNIGSSGWMLFMLLLPFVVGITFALVMPIVNSFRSDGEDIPEIQQLNNENVHATHFTFEKKGVLIPTPSAMPAPGPYYTTW